MPRLYWQLLDLDLPIKKLHPDDTILLVGSGPRSVIVRLRPNPRPGLEQTFRQDVDLLYTVLPSLVDEVWLTPHAHTKLAQLGPMTGTSSPLRAITIPPVRTSRGLFNRSKASIASFGALRLDGSNIVEYALARVQGDHPEPQARTDRRAAILRRGRAVVDDYAALKLDVAYRIENSALFDASVPTTHALEVALVRWDGEAEASSIKELDDLASELEIAYSVARDHAETVGFSHLPGAKEADARRAAKAARLAERAATQGERLAAQQQVVRILDSLALHYLPTAEARRLALPKGWN